MGGGESEEDREKQSLITAGRKDSDGELTPSTSLNISDRQYQE